MNTSKFLSKVIGLYEIIISLAMLTHSSLLFNSMQALLANEPLMLFIGCTTLILGLLMVVSHNIWRWHWQVLVTIVSWIILLKAITILLFPHSLDQLSLPLLSNSYYLYAVVSMDFGFGVLMCYFGFRKE